jgi:hypothetical protein
MSQKSPLTFFPFFWKQVLTSQRHSVDFGVIHGVDVIPGELGSVVVSVPGSTGGPKTLTALRSASLILSVVTGPAGLPSDAAVEVYSFSVILKSVGIRTGNLPFCISNLN